jgi:beta-galactosidase
MVTHCGFRTITFTADSGFYLNDTYMKIKGTCNHQDHAGVGVAVPNSLWEFRIKKLKEMGSNAFRCAHNPPAKEFLDACDKLGLLVMDENRNFNTSPEYQRQLEWLIRRDRNHPSVILWSVFNEELTQGTEMGYEMVRRMSAVVKNLDTTRPVTAAMSGGQFTPINVSKAVDVVGFNYKNGDYDRFHQENPSLPMTSSEDVSGLMQRDVYVTDKNKHTVAAYDDEKPGWGSLHRYSWKMIDERKFLAGCFVWTGFDYRGEPTPYEWPTASSNFGIIDVCGFPKSIYYYYQSQWITDKPVLQLVPHWNWPKDSIGKKIKVMAFTNAEKVKLLLNGKIIGEQATDKYNANTWDVPYQPGKLEAIGYKKGKEVSRFKVETTGEPVSIQLIADRNTIAGDGWDAVPVTVQAIDAKGRLVRTANLPVEFAVSGDGSMIGHGNGDPNSHEMEKGTKRSLYNGLAQAILQSKANGKGPLTLTATSNGLKPATIAINVIDTLQIPAVPVTNKDFIISNGWRISPFYHSKPDANLEVSDNDMNSWAPARANQLQDFKEGSFVVYRTTFRPYAAYRSGGGRLVLKAVTGKAEVWLDKKLVATKTFAESGDILVDILPAQGDRKISVLIESEKGAKAGLGGLVMVKIKE